METLLHRQDSTGSQEMQDVLQEQVVNDDQSSAQQDPQTRNTDAGSSNTTSHSRSTPSQPFDFSLSGSLQETSEEDFSWEMIGLGLEEPLPPPEVMEDLCANAARCVYAYS